MPNSLKCRLKGLVRKGLLSEKDLSRIYTDDDVTEELEKIKGEIIACTQQEEGEVPDCINYGLNLSIEIIDNHIAELKGENK